MGVTATTVASAQRVARRLRKSQIGKAGRLTEEGIRRGIKKGVGPAGPFKPYAESTRRLKRRKGQIFNRVTLRDTGELLASISRSVEGRTALVVISAEYAAHVNAERPFNGIAPGTLTKLRDYILAAWQGAVGSLRKGALGGAAGGALQGSASGALGSTSGGPLR